MAHSIFISGSDDDKGYANRVRALLAAVIVIVAVALCFFGIRKGKNAEENNNRPVVYSAYADELRCEIDGVQVNDFAYSFEHNLNTMASDGEYSVIYDNQTRYYIIMRGKEKTDYILSFADKSDCLLLPDALFCKTVVENMNKKSADTDEDVLFYVKALMTTAYPNNSEKQIDNLMAELVSANHNDSVLLEDNYQVYFETPHTPTYAYGGIINTDIFH